MYTTAFFFIYLMIYVLIHFHRITSHQLYLNYYTLTDSHYKFAMHLLREMLMHFDCCNNWASIERMRQASLCYDG